MFKFLLLLLILLSSIHLWGDCFSNNDCHQGRSCVNKICLFDQDFYSKNSLEDTLKYFFNSIESGRYKGFFLSETEFVKFDIDLSYDLYLVKMEGQVSSLLLNGDETFSSVIVGTPQIIEDLNGQKYLAYINSAIVYDGKTGSDKIRLFTIININGRWAVFKVIDI